ncbi:sulfatase-like hydrolase/transferase [Stieleria sp. TO1_6]|uniref:sulfatase-like hydrolase/transferase n=1 Tax=Stieleria tagensis TaxID=2956795 RepID=UPI00209AD50C|nr:sulfatase-like hydrolase/transferase [Stieleria tagensis]MCO8124212.1 sulfatase-like hydrolase/transferase [Stieleria tagensis]
MTNSPFSRWLPLLGFIASWISLSPLPSAAADPERPNVLLILVDDLKPVLGCYGDPVAQTPHLDGLAARGMRFDAAYCNQAVCAPSRFTLMLGSHSTSTGLYGLGSELRQIMPDAVTLPQHFAAHGYRTESLGKIFHIGHGNHGDPQSFSVPHFKEKVIEYVDPKSTDGGKLTREEAYFTNQQLDRIRSLPRGAAFESPAVQDEAYADGRVAAETIRRLTAAKQRRDSAGTPFFIAAGFARPHLPFSAPKKYWDLYDPQALPMPQHESLPQDSPAVAGKRGGEITNYKPVPEDRDAAYSDQLKRNLIHGYYASTSYVDAQIGKVIDALDRLGLADDTIIVLWGDHGFHLGDLGIWTKHTNYEQANRIPILFVAPGLVQPNQSTGQLAESVDIFPTLAELAGLPQPTGPQSIDGVSLVSVLKDPLARVRDHAYHAYPKQTLGRAIRTERYRMVQWKKPGDDESKSQYELYDYQSDPLESTNVAASQPEVLAKLKAILADYPEAESGGRWKVAKQTPAAIPTPQIANRSIQIEATIKGPKPSGVVLAQGGRERGYALHLVDSKPVFDVRRGGQVTRLQSNIRISGKTRLLASLDRDLMRLSINGGKPIETTSPGLISGQPKDGLSIGFDDLSAAGDYEGPNEFSATIVDYKVTTGPEVAAPIVSFASRPGRWTADRANDWYDKIQWPIGANYVPSSAINQLEMWQADTFDPETIDRELGWAAGIGMNTMRVFLHDIAWQQDPDGFLKRVDQYLEIADRHGIRTMFVFFDGVWHPFPKAGKQPDPTPGRHNSGWVQSPGREILDDPAKQDQLKPYVQAVLRRYRDDPRVLVWDLFNEPNNPNRNSYGSAGSKQELDETVKEQRALELMEKTFGWARQIDPSQPLTVGVWKGDYLNQPTPYQRACIENSDVISFHTYDAPKRAGELVQGLLQMKRPLLCTEYMARGNNSTFAGVLPIFHQHRVAAYNWGFVNGRSQTIYPWDSWKQAYDKEPDPWFHDIFDRDGTAYDPAETRLIRRHAAQPPTKPSKPPEVDGAMSPAEIKAGLASHDRALFIKQGWIRDPYLVGGPDGWYYLTGTTPNPGDPREQTDPYNTGLGPLSLVGSVARVWKSKDLIQWQSLDAPFTMQDGIWAKVKPGAFESTPQDQWFLWAPELHWLGDRWALVHTSPSPVKGANLSLTAGDQVAGPWSNPMGQAIGKRHDPSMFKDDDGTWWLIWGATQIAPIKADFSGLAAKPVAIKPSGDTDTMGHEGCLIQKIHGKYVLFGTGWSTAGMRRGSYNLYYATADKITGPYSERKFAGRFLGHGTPFQDDQGRWWCTAFFNANVPPLDANGIESRDLSQTAQTINRRGTTIVPLDVHLQDDGELYIRAKDPAYATPGPDEAQSFQD